MSTTEDWMEQAACLGFPTALFFPAEHEDDQTDGDNDIAKAICAGCAVRAECRSAQIDEPYGVRGGLEAEERGYGKRGKLGKNSQRGLSEAVAEVLEDHPDDEFTRDTMNDKILEITGRRWPANSVNNALLRTLRNGVSVRRSTDTHVFAYRLNKERK